MGCSFLKDFISEAKNPEVLFLTGKDENEDLKSLKEKLDTTSKNLQKNIFAANLKHIQIKKKPTIKNINLSLEKELYGPISVHLKKYLLKKYNEPIEVLDTSANNLNLFLKNKNKELFKIFDFCEKFRIRPDIVGFLTDSKDIIFEEIKITQLDLKSLGQLLGYCFVARPKEAILISSKAPSLALIKVLKARPDLLDYGPNKKIQIGTWEHNDLKIIEI
jgi:hypothetical protein